MFLSKRGLNWKRLLGFMLVFQCLMFCYVVHTLPVFDIALPSRVASSIAAAAATSSLPSLTASSSFSSSPVLAPTSTVTAAILQMTHLLEGKNFQQNLLVLKSAITKSDENARKLPHEISEQIGTLVNLFTQINTSLTTLRAVDFPDEWVLHNDQYITEPGDLRETYEGIDKCRKMCEDDGACLGITRNKKSNMCVLKAQNQLGQSEEWESETKVLTDKRRIAVGSSKAMLANASDWDGKKCMTNGVVVSAPGVRACEFMRDITDDYPDRFGVVVDKKNAQLRFFRTDDVCATWGLELYWSCYFGGGESSESGGDSGNGVEHEKDPMRKLLAERMSTAVAEAKRMVKFGKYILANPEEKAKFHSAFVKENYPSEEQESFITETAYKAKDVPLLKVASFNLWGFQHWKEREDKIAKLLEERRLDVIGFQEVRLFPNKTNQLDILQNRSPSLSGYHIAYRGCHNVIHEGTEIPPDHLERAQSEGYEEGLAILSRFPILSSQSIILPHHARWSSDPNGRCAVMVTLNASEIAPELSRLQVFLSHTSYADTQQCLNTVALRYWINSLRTENNPQVLMGDFNTYFGWEWPMDVLTHQQQLLSSELYPCREPQKEAQLVQVIESGEILSVPPLLSLGGEEEEGFRDGWTEVFGGSSKLGFTFSNVPDTTKFWDDNPPCRPDRVYMRGSLAAVSGGVLGNPMQLFETADSTDRVSDHLGVELLLLVDAEPALRQSLIQKARAGFASLQQNAGPDPSGVTALESSIQQFKDRGVSISDWENVSAHIFSQTGCQGAALKTFPLSSRDEFCSPCFDLCSESFPTNSEVRASDIVRSIQIIGSPWPRDLFVALLTNKCETENIDTVRERLLPSHGCIDAEFSLVMWKGAQTEQLQLRQLQQQLVGEKQNLLYAIENRKRIKNSLEGQFRTAFTQRLH